MTGSSDISLQELISSQYDRVVAAEMNNDGSATLFVRDPQATVSSQTIPMQPWVVIAGEELASSVPDHAQLVPLQGPGALNYRVHFQDDATYRAAVRFLKDETGTNPSNPTGPYRVVSDLQQQLLSLLPVRLFRGMNFGDLRRLQLDIETLTTPGFDFPNAEREGDEIIMIALRDNTGWETCLAQPRLTEEEILKQMVQIIRDRDPDVIEGHNIFNFDLPYIETRCKRRRVRLKLGRDGSTMRSRASRFYAAEQSWNYKRYEIYGRHIIDTLQLVRVYDVSKREMESHGLKAAARHFKVAAPKRTYVPGSKITEVFRSDPERLLEYAMDDVRETAAISGILSPSYFYQAQLVPFSYQNCVTRGTAARIDAMLVADYMTADTALPRPGLPRSFQGGLTASQQAGVFQNVWHADIQSLYPSILVRHGRGPATDTRGSFIKYLSKLRTFRLDAKSAARESSDPETVRHYDALQSSFKILINSFYGYLGFGQATFNDFDLAEAVTAEGRELLTRMVDFLDEKNAQVIELDTDGIYFVPPAEVTDIEDFEAQIQTVLPDGIDVDIDATYAAMFGYKSKNYALLAEDGEIILKGAAMKSRGLEPFQRRYVRELVTLIMQGGDAAEASKLYRKYETAIAEHRLPTSDFAKRENLSTPPEVYREKLEKGKTRRSAAYELALAADRNYRQGDAVTFYVTGAKKNVAVADAAKLLSEASPDVRDENIAYYLDKLKKLHEKFSGLAPKSEEQGELF